MASFSTNPALFDCGLKTGELKLTVTSSINQDIQILLVQSVWFISLYTYTRTISPEKLKKKTKG